MAYRNNMNPMKLILVAIFCNSNHIYDVNWLQKMRVNRIRVCSGEDYGCRKQIGLFISSKSRENNVN